MGCIPSSESSPQPEDKKNYLRLAAQTPSPLAEMKVLLDRADIIYTMYDATVGTDCPDLSPQYPSYFTALHIACQNRNEELAEAILNYAGKADVGGGDKVGTKLPLHIAFEARSMPCARLLLASFASLMTPYPAERTDVSHPILCLLTDAAGAAMLDEIIEKKLGSFDMYWTFFDPKGAKNLVQLVEDGDVAACPEAVAVVKKHKLF